MVVTIYIAYFLIAVMNTWYLTTQLKLKKQLMTSAVSSEQLKEIRISIGLCMFVYLADILFAVITANIA